MARKLLDEAISNREAILCRGKDVVSVEADALRILAQTLDDTFVAACQTIFDTRGRVVVTGMGKSGHIARKVVATFSATGTPAFYLHPGEAAHGDLGLLVPGDTLIVISNSGNTAELRPVLHHARKLHLAIIGIAAKRASLVMEQADIRLCLPSIREACAANIAPTTSTVLQLAIGDALAMSVMDMRQVGSDSLRSLHPGGAIGLRLTPVRDIMHGPARRGGPLPMVREDASMPDAILTMTSGGFGIAGVRDGEGRLTGVITDGDLRRHFNALATARASDIMTRDPKTVPVDMLAEDALLLLNNNKINAAFVVERRSTGTPDVAVGVVHVHDFVRLGFS